MPPRRLTLLAPLVAFVLVLAACGGGGDDANTAGDAAGGATTTASAGPDGAALYQQRCASCHQANGQGTPGVYPPLAASEYSTSANAGVPIRIVIHGIQGPITVKGQQFNSLMPAYGLGIVMSDAEVAAVLTYVRSSWGNSASAVSAADVARVREETKDHTGAVTAELLRPLMP
jgi:mono/diheme cytochrome c family protein